ncbi:MAG: UMP kinase [Chitinivibrionales bacterium]|nr:UMP kinase [Chitinivibrionales bacterium]
MGAKYKRILLKLSGEALGGTQGFGIDRKFIVSLVEEIKEVRDAGVEIALVIGGGNFFRGISGSSQGMSRTVSDTIGMLATAMNACILSEYLIAAGVSAKVYSALSMEAVAEFYTPRKAVESMKNGSVVLIACGTGNPFFTTDTAAALRCAETGCDVFLKATKVDGIFDSDPMKNPHACKIPSLTHAEALNRTIKVMDSTAFSLCMDNAIPIIVFKLGENRNLFNCVQGSPVGSIVTKENI